jgi:tetratricopeptide (TPR) repeat protein/O-antigen ligase
MGHSSKKRKNIHKKEALLRETVNSPVSSYSFIKSDTIIEDFILGFLFFTVALSFSTSIQAQFTLPKVVALRIGTLLLVIFWIYRIKKCETRVIPRFIFFAGIALGFWWIITTIFALHKYTALNGIYNRYAGFWNYGTYLLIFYVVSSVPMTIKRVENILHLFVMAMLPVSLLAILQYYQIDLFAWLRPVSRSYSTIGSPVPLASLFGLALPFILAFLLRKTDLKSKFYWGILFLIFLIAIMSTKSIGPWIGSFVSIAVVIIFNLVGKQIKIRTAVLLILLYAMFLFGFSSLEFGKPDRPVDSQGVSSVFNQELERERANTVEGRLRHIADTTPGSSLGQRLVFYNTALNIIKDYPIFGVGFDNFRIIYSRYRLQEHNVIYKDYSNSDIVPERVHNEFLNIALNIGIVGLVLYLTFIFAILYLLTRKYKSSVEKEMKLLSIAFVAAIAGFLIQDLSGWCGSEVAVAPFLWIVFALAINFCCEDSRNMNLMKWKRVGCYIFAAFCCVILIFLIVDVVKRMQADRLFLKAKSLSLDSEWDEIKSSVSKGLGVNSNDFHYEDSAGILYTKRLGTTNDVEAYKKGAEILEKAYSHNPFYADILLHRIGLESFALKRKIINDPSIFTERAINALVEMDKNNPAVYQVISELKVSEGKYSEASKYFEKVKAWRGGGVYYYLLEGDIHVGLKRYKDAIISYEKAISVINDTDTRSVVIKQKLALAHIETKNYVKALEVIKSVLEYFPYHVNSYVIMGRIYILTNNIEKAKEALKMALKIKPGNLSAESLLRQIDEYLKAQKEEIKGQADKTFSAIHKDS